MVDVHCHILPGVDDGAADIQESLAMAQSAINDGVTHIVATPHSSAEYRFDYDRCTGCGACYEQCPVHSIEMIPEGNEG